MKRVVLTACAVLMVPVMSGLAQAKKEPKPLPVVPPEGVSQLEALIGNALHAKPTKARRVLVFSKCEGYVHGEGIVYGIKALEIAAKTGAFQAAFATDYAALTDKANLFKYDAVVLNSTTRLKAKDNPALVPNLIEFVKSGRGLCVIHAGADNFYDSPDAAEMVGGQFDGHPWGGGGTWAFKLDDPSHPLNKAFDGKGFKAGDEIYQQKSPFYDRSKLRVLVSLDLSDDKTAAAKGQKRADKDHAVSWIRPYGEGRVFYTSFAHDKRAYLNPAILWHILDGLQYTLGDLKADDKPAAK
ncbi:MAG TPA: ThuA domain-containing protein [Kiritimatiellia bacterium]|nr:ThuA domain-containing protein [Kiritimatiellia bacterium]HPS05906.1 ThuA domain-containing protein [Kiritimatiellia bacterium]